MSSTTYTIGDRVTVRPEYERPIDRGRVYTVRKILKVNLQCEPDSGGQWLRVHPNMLQPATAAPGAAVETVPYVAPYSEGTAVTLTVPTRERGKFPEPDDQLWIVLRDDGHRASVVKLGGDHGRYSRVPRTWLTAIDPTRITWH